MSNNAYRRNGSYVVKRAGGQLPLAETYAEWLTREDVERKWTSQPNAADQITPPVIQSQVSPQEELTPRDLRIRELAIKASAQEAFGITQKDVVMKSGNIRRMRAYPIKVFSK